jgi:hypothetical protein
MEKDMMQVVRNAGHQARVGPGRGQEVWTRLYTCLGTYFRALTEGQTFRRPTKLGIDLPFPGDVEIGEGAILRFRPRWNGSGPETARRYSPDVERLRVSLIREWRASSGRVRLQTYLNLQLTADGPVRTMSYALFVRQGELFRRITALAGRFLTEPGSVLVTGTSRCCNCRRTLTDPDSIARGYGPECAQRLIYLFWLFRGSQGTAPPLPPRRIRSPRIPESGGTFD